MDRAEQEKLKSRYLAAVDAFVDKVKTDPSVIAIVVCGSLAYDLIWEKSDVDMAVVIRDQAVKDPSYSVIEDGIVINVELMTRSGFRRDSERSVGGSFFHSLFAKGTVAYSSDESFTGFFEEQKAIGDDDIALSVFFGAGDLIGIIEKAEKCLRVKRDLPNAQYFILKAAEVIARTELCLAGEPFSRRAIERVLELRPEVITPFYTDAMSGLLDEAGIEGRIADLKSYLSGLVEVFRKPVLAFMADQEIKTSTVIAKHFRAEPHFIIHVFEYLADRGLIERAGRTIRPTPKGKPAVEEIGYVYVP
jgi:uncharacterized protein